jgi:hypothetical protein
MAHFPALPVWWELDGTAWNNGADASGNRLLAESVTGWTSSTPPRPDVDPRVNASGGYRGPNYRGPKIVEIKGKAESVSRLARQALADQLAALCGDPNTLYPLTRHEHGRDLTMWVELNDAIDVTERRDGLTLDVNIQVIAVDGVKYTADNDPVNTTLATPAPGGIAWNGTPSPTGGIEWNGSGTVTGGLIYQSAGGANGRIVLTNTGTAPAPILFQITPTPSVGNPSLLDTTTLRRITYGGTLASGVLTIDTSTGMADLSGINVGGALSDAEFFMVPPQSSLEVLFTASGGSAALTAVNANAFA